MQPAQIFSDIRPLFFSLILTFETFFFPYSLKKKKTTEKNEDPFRSRFPVPSV